MKKEKSRWLAPKRRKDREAEIDKLAKKMIKTDIKRMNVLVPAEIYAEFKSKVSLKRKKIGDVIVDFISKYVKEN